MINKMLNDLVNDYMESQFVNYGNDIGFFKARKELLGSGTIGFYEVGTYIPKYVKHKGFTSALPNPIIADINGKFENVVGEGVYKITVCNGRGMMLLECENKNADD